MTAEFTKIARCLGKLLDRCLVCVGEGGWPKWNFGYAERLLSIGHIITVGCM